MFMHASIIHIGGNMIFLWIFGNNVEDAMGPVKFLVFYIARRDRGAGAAGRDRAELAHPDARRLGAIAAVLGGYIVLYPRARVLTLVIIIFFFTVIELPALVMLGIWFAEQAVFAAAGLTTPDRRRRRRRVLRPRRRVRLRPAHDQAAGDPANQIPRRAPAY